MEKEYNLLTRVFKCRYCRACSSSGLMFSMRGSQHDIKSHLGAAKDGVEVAPPDISDRDRPPGQARQGVRDDSK